MELCTNRLNASVNVRLSERRASTHGVVQLSFHQVPENPVRFESDLSQTWNKKDANNAADQRVHPSVNAAVDAGPNAHGIAVRLWCDGDAKGDRPDRDSWQSSRFSTGLRHT